LFELDATLSDNDKGLVTAGAALIWRRQRVLWWVYAVNLTIGFLGAAGARTQLDKLLRYSLAGQSLVDRFDLGMFSELVSQPAANLMRSAGSSFHFALLFPLFMLFVTGGILAVYQEDRSFTTGDFFAASGAFFWRFVRLALFSIVPFGLLAAAWSGVNKLSDYVGDRAVSGKTGFYILLAGTVIVVLLVLFVRLWFDIAQVRAVVQNEHSMWRNLWKALQISRSNIFTLFRVYLSISGVAWVTLALGFYIWTKLLGKAILVTVILLQFVIFMQLLARLWQRASAVTWYKRHAALVPTDVVDFTTPPPIELIEPAPSEAPVVPEQSPTAPESANASSENSHVDRSSEPEK